MSQAIEMGDLEKSSEKNEKTSTISSGSSSSGSSISVGFTGLSKDELMAVEKDETIWRTIRIGLFILFWVAWFGMLAAAIVIIILTPKCPPRPDLNSWEKTCMYRLNPYAFKDSGNDNVGDIKGINDKLSYIEKDINAKTIIIDQLVKGSGGKYRRVPNSFREVDPILGNDAELIKFVKKAFKQGIQVIMTLDFNGVGLEHPLVKTPSNLMKTINKDWLGRNGQSSECDLNGAKYYSSFGAVEGSKCAYVDLDLTKEAVITSIEADIKYWLNDVGVTGILLTNAAFFVEDDKKASSPGATGNKNAFFNEERPGQLFTEGSVKFVRRLKTLVDKLNAVSSKKKVLMVEAGDVGRGVQLNTTDPMVRFVEGASPAADIAFISDLYFRRGFKGEASKAEDVLPNLENYFAIIKATENKRRFAASTASPYDLRHSSIEALVGSLFAPSLSVIQMGSEIDFSLNEAELTKRVGKIDQALPGAADSFDFFPNASRSLSYLYSTGSTFDKDVFNDAMMPWDLNSFADAGSYKDAFLTNDDVKLYSAVGSPLSRFSVIKKLTKLKTSESVQWGNQTWILPPIKTVEYSRLVYSLYAEGYPAFVVVMISPKKQSSISGEALTLNRGKNCPTASLELSFPQTPKFKNNDKVDMSNVFVDTSAGDTLYIFKCNSA